MKNVTCSLLLLILLVAGSTAQISSTSRKAANTKKTWPHPIPLRLRDADNKDLFVMTLGDVAKYRER